MACVRWKRLRHSTAIVFSVISLFALLTFTQMAIAQSPPPPTQPEAPVLRTLTVSITGGGLVEHECPAVYCAGRVIGSYDYLDGQTANISALPDGGYVFSRWSGAAVGGVAFASIYMDRDKAVTAHFLFEEQSFDEWNLNVQSSPQSAGGVSLRHDSSSATIYGSRSETYYDGSLLTIEAIPSSGYQFVRWQGDVSGSKNPQIIVLTSNKSVTAVFERAQATEYTLTATDTPAEGGNVNIAGGDQVRVGIKRFESGESAVVVAVPNNGWRFLRWSGDASGVSQVQALVMDRNKSVVAHWEAVSQTNTTPSGGTSPSSGTSTPSTSLPPNSQVIQIDAGEDHTCVVTDSRIAVCWGRNDDGQAVAAEGTFAFVSAGTRHSCGLTSNGGIRCWGSDTHSQLVSAKSGHNAVGAGGSSTCFGGKVSFTPCRGELTGGFGSGITPNIVGVGSKHACSLRNTMFGILAFAGRVFCSGDNVYGQSETVSGKYIALSVGAYHNCVRDNDGGGQCWGRNQYGQTAVPTGVRFIDIAAGTDHTCGVKGSNGLTCWGRSDNGQITSPGGNDWSLTAAGGSHSCAVNENGKVTCWGDNTYGQLNVPAGIAAPRVAPGIGSTPAGEDPSDGEGDLMQGAIATIEVRIIARRATDGRIEFGMRGPDGRELLPPSRYFPAYGPGHERWLRSSVIDLGNGFQGRIIARYHTSDGRTEFGFRVLGYGDAFPQARYFPAAGQPNHNRWLRSSEIEIRQPR